MPATAKKLDVEPLMDVEGKLALLGERTETLQRDVTEIKSNLTKLDIKLDTKIEGLQAKVGTLAERVAAIEPKLDSFATSLDARLQALDAKVGALGSSFDAKLSAHDAKIARWMVATVLTLITAEVAVSKFFS